MAIDLSTASSTNPFWAPGGTADIGRGIGAIYDLATGIKGTDIDRAREAASLADPFASQRGQYQTQLQQLLSDPSSFKTDPGYKFALGQGQEAIGNASDRLYGTRRTGSLAPELAKYTEGYASQAYDERIKQLMQLAGANSGSPGTAGTLLQGGFDRNQNALAGGALGALAPLIAALGRGGFNIPGFGGGTLPGIGGGSGHSIGGNESAPGFDLNNDLGEGDFNDLINPWVNNNPDWFSGQLGDISNNFQLPDFDPGIFDLFGG